MTSTNHKAIAAIGVGSVIWLALQFHAATQLTPTHDEYWHLPIGVSIWKTGRFDQDPINPPLVRLVASAPLAPLVSDPTPESSNRESDYGDAFIAASNVDARTLYLPGRVLIAVATLGGTLLLSRMAWQIAGWPAAMMAFLLMQTDPNVFAHGGLVTHDAPTSVAFVAVLWGMLRYYRRPTLRRALVVGATLGVALLAKFTSLVWLPVLVALAFGYLLVSRFKDGRNVIVHLLAAVALALVIVNVVYLGQGTMRSFGSYANEAPHLTRVLKIAPWLADVPVPFPEQYVIGVDRVRAVVQSLHPVYLEGEHTAIGFPDYYYKCWLYKTPHVVQLLSLIGLVVLLIRAWRDAIARVLLLIAIPVILLVVVPASLGWNQLGYRYLLPVYPFTILVAACGCGPWIATRRTRVRNTFIGLGCVLCVLSLRFHPNNLTYFNELAGGPQLGRELLIDSNIDWGQSLHQLRASLDSADKSIDGLAYFGSFPPVAIGFHVDPPPSFKPRPGRYAVSVNYGQGRSHTIREQEGWRNVSMGEFIYFTAFEPVGSIGHSIDVYELSEADVADFEANYGTFIDDAVENSLFMTQ